MDVPGEWDATPSQSSAMPRLDDFSLLKPLAISPDFCHG